MTGVAYVVMGVSGCGKSTVGRALAARLNLDFRDGDELHPPANIAKMVRGEPLADVDREPWLREVGAELRPGTVMACSALRRRYRDLLREVAPGDVLFIYLHGTRETLIERMRRRNGHFMPIALFDSQVATLEEPGRDERHLRVGIAPPTAEIVEAIVSLVGK
ncbi:gluconokinase [Paracoccus liaowanqingii]|uniref:Gluconokinase n=1 Tax=Paracoccus liaowanqingii TaxID=2560053 RepID=A0A4P7HME8_9RHOB|nr:gluconokinase [Paracoccus liaowanqingii]QBX34331.1 gluconokinase [Paracoccus liaowanqingii]